MNGCRTNWCAWGSLNRAANSDSFHIPAGCFAIQLQAAPEGTVRAKGSVAACLVLNDRILGALQKLGGISVAASGERPPRTLCDIVKLVLSAMAL